MLNKRDIPKKKRLDPIVDIICCLYCLWSLLPKYNPKKKEISRITSLTPGKVFSFRIWHKISEKEKKIIAEKIGAAMDSARWSVLKLRTAEIMTETIVITSPWVSIRWTLKIYKNTAVITIAYDIVVNIEKRIMIADAPRKHRDMPATERIKPIMHSSILIWLYLSTLLSKLSIKLKYFSFSSSSGTFTF